MAELEIGVDAHEPFARRFVRRGVRTVSRALPVGDYGVVVEGRLVASVIPGLLAALAIVYTIRHTPTPAERHHQPIRLRVRPVLRGQLGRFMAGIAAFEVGNCAATLLILRATELLEPGRNDDRATQLALGLYVAYNLSATVISVPAGRYGDHHSPTQVLVTGAALFTAAYLWFAAGPASVVTLAPAFLLAGAGIGCAETAEHAAVAANAPAQLRGSAFGLLAAIQSAGNLAASTVAGLLWTAVSPVAAFCFLAAAMAIAVAGSRARGRRARTRRA